MECHFTEKKQIDRNDAGCVRATMKQIPLIPLWMQQQMYPIRPWKNGRTSSPRCSLLLSVPVITMIIVILSLHYVIVLFAVVFARTIAIL